MRTIYLLATCILGFMAISYGNDSLMQNSSSEIVPSHNLILHLENACKLAKKISDPGKQQPILAELESCKECIKKLRLAGEFDEIGKCLETLYENINEILSECGDEGLMIDIPGCIEKGLEEFTSMRRQAMPLEKEK